MLCAGFLCLCVILGGGTRQGSPIDGALQLLSIPLLLWALWRLDWDELLPAAHWLLIGCGLLLAWLLLQCLPLPPVLWSGLPGRAALAEELSLTGMAESWRPISLDWQASIRAVLALLPPLALLLAVLGLSYRQRVGLLRLLVLLAVLAALLGLLQLSLGKETALRWHEITNPSSAVGPFANRNHQAAMLAGGIPFAVALALSAAAGNGGRHVVKLMLGVLAAAILIIGLAMTHSRAGVLVGCVAMLGAALLFWLWKRRADETHTAMARTWLVGGALLVVVFVVQYALFGLIQRFDKDPLDDQRWEIATTTLQGIDQLGWPGAGAGTFPTLYDTFEKPETRSGTYVNRAHNDWLEWWLEGGYPLLVLLVAGLVLLGLLTWEIWRTPVRGALWQRACTISLWGLLLHSLFDYPLRTTAMAAVAAVLVACLVSELSDGSGRRPRIRQRSRQA